MEIAEAPEGVRYVYPCRFGEVRTAEAEGRALIWSGPDVLVPAGTRRFSVTYG